MFELRVREETEEFAFRKCPGLFRSRAVDDPDEDLDEVVVMAPGQFHTRIPDRELDVIVFKTLEVERRCGHRLYHHVHLQTIQNRLS